jgi:hypothetical protein
VGKRARPLRTTNLNPAAMTYRPTPHRITTDTAPYSPAALACPPGMQVRGPQAPRRPCTPRTSSKPASQGPRDRTRDNSAPLASRRLAPAPRDVVRLRTMPDLGPASEYIRNTIARSKNAAVRGPEAPPAHPPVPRETRAHAERMTKGLRALSLTGKPPRGVMTSPRVLRTLCPGIAEMAKRCTIAARMMRASIRAKAWPMHL